jgi:hypothetical protein
MSRIAAPIVLLVSTCLAFSSLSDEFGWYVDGVLVADEPWRGHNGPFLAMLILTDDPKSVYDFWNTKPGNVPIPSTSKVAPGASVEAIVFFVGCEPDPRGNCSVWGTATVISPNGSLLADRTEVPLWVGRPPPPGRALGISEHGIGMSNESLPGEYTFRIVVKDRVARRQVSLEQKLSIVQ